MFISCCASFRWGALTHTVMTLGLASRRFICVNIVVTLLWQELQDK